MRIVFYLENIHIRNIDLTKPQLGNPGCGGTEYLFVATPYYLTKKYGKKHKFILLANVINKLPKNFQSYKVKDIYEAAQKAKELNCDIFIYRPKRKDEVNLLDIIDEYQLPTIGWAHITPTPPVVRKMAKSKYFKALVCVEHEQYDLIQDSAITRKLTYIVNGFDVENFSIKTIPKKDLKLVTYLGALVPQKGFHLLAKAWPKVLLEVPDAKLIVIGSGRLYGANTKLGPWKIADKDYENTFIIPYLKDKEGNPHSSVSFLGTLGHEKKSILYKTLIGIPNPTGETENCPGAALEFQACNTAVVTGAYYGLLDTVKKDVTGLTGKSEKDLIKNICYLLKNPDKAIKLGSNGQFFVNSRYNWTAVTEQWFDLLIAINNNEKIKRIPFKTNWFRHNKILIILNRPFQLLFGNIFYWPSFFEIREFIAKIYRNIKLIFK